MPIRRSTRMSSCCDGCCKAERLKTVDRERGAEAAVPSCYHVAPSARQRGGGTEQAWGVDPRRLAPVS